MELLKLLTRLRFRFRHTTSPTRVPRLFRLPSLASWQFTNLAHLRSCLDQLQLSRSPLPCPLPCRSFAIDVAGTLSASSNAKLAKARKSTLTLECFIKPSYILFVIRICFIEQWREATGACNNRRAISWRCALSASKSVLNESTYGRSNQCNH